MVFIILLSVILAVILGGSLYAYVSAFYSPKQNRERLPSLDAEHYTRYREDIQRIFQALQARPCEFVQTYSQDGLLLSARYYHVKDGAPLDIAFHGYRSSPLTDFCGGAALSLELGHNLLLVDQRSHGKSQGRSIAFGVQERWDVLSWVSYALERFGEDTKILLYGISMGAATVLMASELELPENIKGIIADCPYASPKAIICKVAEHRGINAKLVWPFIRLGGRLYGGFEIMESSAVTAVKKAKLPILLLHGEADNFVPCAMSHEIARSNPEHIQLYTFPNAGHGLSYLEDTPSYKKIVTEFIEKILG